MYLIALNVSALGLWDVYFILVTVNNCRVQTWITEFHTETFFLFFSVKKVVPLPGVIVFCGKDLKLNSWNIVAIID